MKRAIHTLNWTLALMLLAGSVLGIATNWSEGRKFTLDEMIIAPFAVVWAYSVFTRVRNRLAWAINMLGGVIFLFAGLEMLDQVRAHIRLGHLDPSDGTLFAIVFGGF